MSSQKVLLGADMSRYQYGIWSPSYFDFIILKATEGKTYDDVTMDKFIADIATEVPDSPPFIGFYHYAHPENNQPANEVDNFLKKIKPHIGNCFMALDVEGEAFKNKNIDNWCLGWCNMVHKLTGTKPLIYISAAYAHYVQKTLKEYPLWVAHYNVNKPASKRMTINPTIWQYTSKPFDMDLFYGDKADMVKLIRGK